MMRTCLMLSAALSVIRGGGPGDNAPPALRGQANDALPQVLPHTYNLVYYGGEIHADLHLNEPIDPVAPHTALSMNAGIARTYVVCQLPEDGSLPPELTEDAHRSPFSAILRYHPDNAEEVTRVGNWITQNMQYCRDILVASYPAKREESVEELTALSNLAASFVRESIPSTSFVGQRVRSMLFIQDYELDQGPALTDLLREYEQQAPRHYPPLLPERTNVYRLVYVGGSLADDVWDDGYVERISNDAGTGGTLVKLSSNVILPDGSQSLTRFELRDGGEGIPAAWNTDVGDGDLPKIAAIVKLGENSVEWIRQNVARCDKVLVVVRPSAIMLLADAYSLSNLQDQYGPKIQLVTSEPTQLNRVLTLVQPALGDPHLIETPNATP